MEPADIDMTRRRSLASVTAEDRARAERVSIRRVARLFAPYRLPLVGVTAIIVVASVVGLASPSCCAP